MGWIWPNECFITHITSPYHKCKSPLKSGQASWLVLLTQITHSLLAERNSLTVSNFIAYSSALASSKFSANWALTFT